MSFPGSSGIAVLSAQYLARPPRAGRDLIKAELQCLADDARVSAVPEQANAPRRESGASVHKFPGRNIDTLQVDSETAYVI